MKSHIYSFNFIFRNYFTVFNYIFRFIFINIFVSTFLGLLLLLLLLILLLWLLIFMKSLLLIYFFLWNLNNVVKINLLNQSIFIFFSTFNYIVIFDYYWFILRSTSPLSFYLCFFINLLILIMVQKLTFSLLPLALLLRCCYYCFFFWFYLVSLATWSLILILLLDLSLLLFPSLSWWCCDYCFCSFYFCCCWGFYCYYCLCYDRCKNYCYSTFFYEVLIMLKKLTFSMLSLSL